jgi:protein-S-isoprenylcysteine O-methyltransferase Ste14
MGSALSLLWLAWLVSWLVASTWTARTVAQQTDGSRIVESVPIWIGAILLFTSAAGPLSKPFITSPRWLDRLALVVALVGFALTWWARITLGRWWSGAVTLKADHQLIRSGPYAVTRHPIYTGLLVAVLATALERDSPAGWLGGGLILAGLVLKLRHEEHFLGSRFGSAYDAYKRDVAALIPGIW